MKNQRTETEKAQRELNEILERTQTPDEFNASVNDRLARHAARLAKAPKAKKTLLANRSLFNRL